MVAINAVREANAAFVKESPLVAVFVGGTSGLGEYALRELVKTHASHGGGNELRIYLVGRNAAAAERIISECGAVSVSAQVRFVKADASLMRDVDRVSGEIIRLENEETSGTGRAPRIDLLVMTQGGVYFGPRNEASEGLDLSMAMHYYSRARFTTQLLPLLLASDLPTGARVISVYAAGMETKFLAKDVSLRQPGSFTFDNARSHVVFLTTGFFEKLAADHPGRLGLVHMFPGMVLTPAYRNFSSAIWFKALWAVSSPFLRALSTSAEDSGQRILFLATHMYPAKGKGVTPQRAGAPDEAVGTDGKPGTGSYGVGPNNAVTSPKKRNLAFDGVESVQRAIFPEFAWTHTMQTFEEIDNLGKASG